MPNHLQVLQLTKKKKLETNFIQNSQFANNNNTKYALRTICVLVIYILNLQKVLNTIHLPRISIIYSRKKSGIFFSNILLVTDFFPIAFYCFAIPISALNIVNFRIKKIFFFQKQNTNNTTEDAQKAK